MPPAFKADPTMQVKNSGRKLLDAPLETDQAVAKGLA
jgi:hypothetical protein